MTDQVTGPVEVRSNAGLGPGAEVDDLTRAIASAWARHAQRVKYQFPGGCGGYIALQTPEVMAELGFQQAAREVASLVLADQRARLRGLVQDVRDANSAVAGPERFRLLTHSQDTAWRRLIDALDGPNASLSGGRGPSA